MVDLVRMVSRYGVYFVVGDGSCLINPIHGADLAGQGARCIDDTPLHKRSFELGGPDIFSFRGIGELAFSVAGRSRRMLAVPPGILTAFGKLVAPVNPNVGAMFGAASFLAETDAVGAPVRTHHLSDFFKQLAAEGATQKWSRKLQSDSALVSYPAARTA